ncbi:aldehyde ferredoxin oxidoreductase [Anopheles sinensis]|uniref:Aldehyde ferredoxin oxidoreductase n=1 Tax=Anopheles sinensis TaxID=74873 RepID=A0A084VKY7_ANOSI|nr:aldehyde ferredoxin oxidoreductase [Anopheles sinensis]
MSLMKATQRQPTARVCVWPLPVLMSSSNAPPPDGDIQLQVDSTNERTNERTGRMDREILSTVVAITLAHFQMSSGIHRPHTVAPCDLRSETEARLDWVQWNPSATDDESSREEGPLVRRLGTLVRGETRARDGVDCVTTTSKMINVSKLLHSSVSAARPAGSG